MSPTQESKPKAAAPAPEAPQPTTQTPTPTQKTNTMAIVAIIFAFIFPLIGLILGVVALGQIKKRNEGGHGLAVASVILSIVFIVIEVLAIVMFWGTLFALNNQLKKNGVDISTNGTINVKDNEGNSASLGNAKIPSGFPSDVPIYKPSDVIVGIKVDKGYNVTLVTNDNSQTVADFYKSQLPKNGWQAEDTGAVFNTNVVQVYTKGAQTLQILIGNDQKANNGKQTSVSLTVATKSE